MRTVGSTYKLMLRFLLAGMLSCVSVSLAQETADSQDNAVSEAADVEEPTSERRVRRLGDVSGDEFELDLAVPDAAPGGESRSSEFDLPDPEQNAQLQQILSSLAIRPGDSGALAQLSELLSVVLTDAHALADGGRLEEMDQLLQVVRNVNPRQAGLAEAFQRFEDLQNIVDWLAAAGSAMERGSLIVPGDPAATANTILENETLWLLLKGITVEAK